MLPFNALEKLQPFIERTELVNVLVDTPKGSPFKLKYESEGLFRVHKAMPLGFAFPFNFGFLPSTRAEDGDALDILLLTEYIMPVGALVAARLLAVLEARQADGRKKNRNDRLIAIPVELKSKK